MRSKKYLALVCLLLSMLLTACSLKELDELNNKYENKATAITPAPSKDSGSADDSSSGTSKSGNSSMPGSSKDSASDKNTAADGSSDSTAPDTAAESSTQNSQTLPEALNTPAADSDKPAAEAAQSNQNTATDTVSPDSQSTASTDNSSEEKQENSASDNSSSQTDEISSQAAGSQNSPEKNSESLSQSEGSSTGSQTASNDSVNEPGSEKRDFADRDSYRNMTFLVWAPAFEYGIFSGKDSGSTYDYASFTDVSENEFSLYKTKLLNAGYTDILKDSGSSFKAKGSDKWCVTLEYSNGTLLLGAGFDEESSKNDKSDALYATTMLQYIPKFTAGSYTASESEDDESAFTYIYYSNVSESDVRSYIDSLKKAGYIYACDEGDSDGIIWYIALNEDVFSCYLAYDSGILKLGCGYGD
ncbi:MAG: MSCRAMM family adhesin SdrC [Lachnospiraceae bacterium]|nr:MSCRAMM family adhesin SdrC [Lachnospiraceae bacterium]